MFFFVAFIPGGSKFPVINVFKDVNVWPGDELVEQRHVSISFQFPILRFHKLQNLI